MPVMGTKAVSLFGLQESLDGLPSPTVNAALVPVRSISGSKNRLASCLQQSQRERLALAMLEDMLAALAAATTVERIAVVSADPGLLTHARGLGAEIIDESEARGLNAAVTMAAEKLEADGVDRLLTIPGDVPLLDPAEIDTMFTTDPERYPVVLAPSASVTGTNGLLTSPPTVIDFRFEGRSLEAHRRASHARGVQMKVMPLASFAVDVDTPADLAALDFTSGRRTCRLVEGWLDGPLAESLRAVP